MKKIIIYIFSITTIINWSCSKNDDNDILPPIDNSGPIEVYQTTRSSNLLMGEMKSLHFTNEVEGITIVVDSTFTYQQIEGFGASLTGSSAFLIKNMEEAKRKELLKDLFSNEGISLKYLRLPIGSSDFSLADYTYCDLEGIENFDIPEIDRRDLVPVLKEILSYNSNIRLLGSPWTAPAWMKSNNSLYGGSLKGPEVYGDFAQYFSKYIQYFEKEGITINALTLQNEPMHAISTYPTMKMTWQEQATIIGDYVGPLFKKENIKTDILVWDHNFDNVDYPLQILRNPVAKQYISGVAFHGYGGKPEDLQPLLAEFPDEPIYFTEQSGGGWNTDDQIGNMLYYMKSMLIPMINYGSRNFLMWNLALDENNGPVTTTGGGCQDCRGVVTIDSKKSYTFNEEYYLLGHFSKFIESGANRIKNNPASPLPTGVDICTFLNPDGSKVVVILNQSGDEQVFTIRTGARRFNYKLLNESVVTFRY